jgi:hypothetical protein
MQNITYRSREEIFRNRNHNKPEQKQLERKTFPNDEATITQNRSTTEKAALNRYQIKSDSL